jgi:hypothetical protein
MNPSDRRAVGDPDAVETEAVVLLRNSANLRVRDAPILKGEAMHK